MESTLQTGFHADLKRETSAKAAVKASGDMLVNGPLFERYQFFTPGELHISDLWFGVS